MLFNSLPFAVFFALLYLLLRLAPRRMEARLLLGASLLFYTMWHPAYLVLLGVEAGVNYLFLRRIVLRGRSRALLAGSIVFTLGLLGWFKYSALTIRTLAPILEAGFGFGIEIPNFILPLGISFYSFQIIAMNIDAYRGQVDELPSFPRYLLFISFFPQLIAGPIVRAGELLPQIERGSRRTPDRSRRGIWLLSSGAFKKIVMGDFLLAGFVDEVFGSPGVGAAGAHLIGMYAFAFQIYFDFSGYTDMARGLALLMGFELPRNFKEPYLSRDPSEFWRCWHITLSTWLRDYLYIPLGGNRAGATRVHGNLLVTMLLGGLWHGAAWKFMIWGGLHGLLLVIHRRFGSRERGHAALAWRDVPRILVLFHLVCLIWLFFRAESTGDAFIYLSHLFTGDYSSGLPLVETAIVFLSMGFHVLERLVLTRRHELQELLAKNGWGSLVEGAALGTIATLCLAAMGSGGEFIYFQF
jgi:alginate O-acetyltransferase complex protein AlgI